LVWGSSFILIKKALVAFTPLQVGSGRVVISFVAFLPLFFYKYKSIDWSKFKPLFVIGLCGSGIPAILYAIGQTHIPSSIAGVLNSLTPIFTFLLAILFFRQKFSPKQMIGIALGFVGVMIIFFAGNTTDVNFEYAFVGIIIIATISYAISANTVNRYLKGIPPLIISIVSFVIIGPPLLIYLLSTDFISQVTIHPHGLRSLLALMTLSLIGTFMANILFFKLIQITDAIFSTSVAFLIPIVALAWGFIDGETIGFYHFVSLILILIGVFLIKYIKPK